MAEPYQLKSGKWAIRPSAYGDRAFFTGKTRGEVMLKAGEWMTGRREKHAADMTVAVALESYIEDCEETLSPSTIRGYEAIKKRILKYDIQHHKIDMVSAPELQRFVKQLAKKYKPKTVRNTYGLLSASLRFYGVHVPESVSMPKEEEKRYFLPTGDELNTMLDEFDGTPMKTAVLLAAFAGLRRSEIVALDASDVNHKTKSIRIHAAVVEDKDKTLVRKATKTSSSTRTVMLPDVVYENIKDIEGSICPMTPKAISCQWEKKRKKHGIRARFHDLRHYSASLSHAIGVPDQYIMSRHGWKTDFALKTIYRNELDDFTVTMNNKINTYIDKQFAG